LVLDARGELPVPRPHAPAGKYGWIVERGRNEVAEVDVQTGTAHVSARRAEILGGRVEEVAIGEEVAVAVGPVPAGRRLHGQTRIVGVRRPDGVLFDATARARLDLRFSL